MSQTSSCSGIVRASWRWILPQDPEPKAILLSVSGARIDDGAIVTDSAQLELLKVRGPGEVLAYLIQPDGEPVLWLSSRAESVAVGGIPVSRSDTTRVAWAFTQPVFRGFILGFLGTALPRMLSAPPLGVRNTLLMAFLHLAMVVAYATGHLALQRLLGYQGFVLLPILGAGPFLLFSHRSSGP
jgi:hypothetical protein